MTEVISVRFRGGCKNYYFNPNGNQVKMGDQVIVETAQGPEFATCTEGNHEVEDSAIVKPLSPMLRMATDSDRRTVEQNKKRESEAFDICEKKIAAHGLEMKLVNVSASFDGNKIVFYFTADGRVDFRELVRDLAGVFRARIELRQIGVRDEAKMIGGLGICGRHFCCSQFLYGHAAGRGAHAGEDRRTRQRRRQATPPASGRPPERGSQKRRGGRAAQGRGQGAGEEGRAAPSPQTGEQACAAQADRSQTWGEQGGGPGR